MPTNERPVILFNRDRFRSFQFTLYHSIVCQDGECHCVKVPAREADRRGEFDTVEDSVFLAGRSYSKPLPRVVLEIPQLREAMSEQSPPWIMEANRLAEVQVYQPNTTSRRRGRR